jgi:hypothetical protein
LGARLAVPVAVRRRNWPSFPDVPEPYQHYDHHVAQPRLAERVEIQAGCLNRAVLGDLAGPTMDRVGDPFRRGTAVARAVLDAEIAVGAALRNGHRPQPPRWCPDALHAIEDGPDEVGYIVRLLINMHLPAQT